MEAILQEQVRHQTKQPQGAPPTPLGSRGSHSISRCTGEDKSHFTGAKQIQQVSGKTPLRNSKGRAQGPGHHLRSHGPVTGGRPSALSRVKCPASFEGCPQTAFIAWRRAGGDGLVRHKSTEERRAMWLDVEGPGAGSPSSAPRDPSPERHWHGLVWHLAVVGGKRLAPHAA